MISETHVEIYGRVKRVTSRSPRYDPPVTDPVAYPHLPLRPEGWRMGDPERRKLDRNGAPGRIRTSFTD